MSRSKVLFSFMVCAFFFSRYALAQTVVNDGSSASQIVIQDTPSGVAVEFAADGRDWVRIYTTGVEPLNGSDSVDLEEGFDIAADKARIELARFLMDQGAWERINSKTYSSHITSNDNQALRERIRTVTETLRVNGSVLQKGVLRLSEYFDRENKRAVVVMGVSRNSIGVANDLAKEFNKVNDAARNREEGGSDGLTRVSPNYPNKF